MSYEAAVSAKMMAREGTQPSTNQVSPQNTFDASVEELVNANVRLETLKRQLSGWLFNFAGSTPIEDEGAVPEAPTPTTRTVRLTDQVRRLGGNLGELQALVTALDAE